jgi:uncharacterized Zn-binding protein involved in type VI secretion
MPDPAKAGATHGPATVPQGSPTVTIGGMPALRATDQIACAGGPPNMIAKGSATVEIEGLPAARIGDPTAHGGVLSAGDPTVQIGG